MTQDLPQAPAPNPSSSWLRRGLTALGLLVFDLLMIVPATVYAALLAALYLVAIIVYVFGIALTSSSLAGVNEFVIREPGPRIFMHRHAVDHDVLAIQQVRLRMEVNPRGLRVFSESDPAAAPRSDVEVTIGKNDDRRALGKNDALGGIAIILAGIAMVLINMVITRYSWRGLCRVGRFQMNLLK